MTFSTRSMSIASAVLTAACATQPIPATRDAPGFLLGLFHGAIAIFALVGSLFMHIRVYAFPNDGFWYDFGFVTGLCGFVLIVILSSMARIGGMLTGEFLIRAAHRPHASSS